ncbi:MAG: class I tRNA ligase family protein, partial [Bradymonadaceae bacterium]
MGDYKDSLHLPDTDFPMRANLSEREPEQVEEWEEAEIYDRMIAKRRDEGAERFIFHDGPPYANGRLHHGHILNKALKDFIVKYQNMAGRLCEFVPGWDCHGLPIEHEVEQDAEGDIREWSETEIDFVSRVLSRYLDATDYPRVVAHVPPEGYREVC